MTVANGFPPFYRENQSVVLTNVNQLYLLFSIFAIFFGFLLVLPGIRGRERCLFLLRWSMGLIIGASIITCLQGAFWHVGSVKTPMRYTMANAQSRVFNLQLMIGLQHYNISLQDNSSLINMNEQFYITNTDSAIRMGLEKGLPFPILKVAEHFSLNKFNAQWKWGRLYWLAGHYAFYLLWTALIAWVLTVILFQLVLFYGGLSLAMTGIFMLLGNLSFASSSFSGTLRIRIGVEDPPTFLQIHPGWCFWLCLVIGIFSFVLGSGIIILDSFYPNLAKRLFSFKLDRKMRSKRSLSQVSKSNYFESSFKNGNSNPTYSLPDSISIDQIDEEAGKQDQAVDDNWNAVATNKEDSSIHKEEDTISSVSSVFSRSNHRL